MLLPKQENKKGFTLIELMVAIAIIAVLATIGYTVFSGATVNARDTKRRQDIDAIVSALESKKISGQNYYQAVAATDFAGGSVPADPKTAATTNPQNYCFIAYNALPPTTPPTTLTAAHFSNKQTCTAAAGSPIAAGTTLLKAFAAGDPAVNVSSWEICAFLEQAGGIYCKIST